MNSERIGVNGMSVKKKIIRKKSATTNIINSSTSYLDPIVVREKFFEAAKKLPAVAHSDKHPWGPDTILSDSTVRALLIYRPKPAQGRLRGAFKNPAGVGEATLRREIESVHKAASKLQKKLEHLHASGRQALGLSNRNSAEYRDGFEQKLDSFLITTQFYELPELSETQGKGGRPRLSAEARFTQTIALIYKIYTGKMPTLITDVNTEQTGGIFLEFVTEIFKILDVKASPLAQARMAIAAMKKTTQKKQE